MGRVSAYSSADTPTEVVATGMAEAVNDHQPSTQGHCRRHVVVYICLCLSLRVPFMVGITIGDKIFLSHPLSDEFAGMADDSEKRAARSLVLTQVIHPSRCFVSGTVSLESPCMEESTACATTVLQSDTVLIGCLI
ncbi:hypothetical protein LZ32DRAFT_621286 [Colletotrichum eremochloae]|nr:hypothetical protein LZ32DRAFT_621286 [Colletotrichum eremochloae]